LKGNTAKQKYREGIYAVIKFIDGELKKCLKKFLKEKGETKLGAYSEFNPSDGRRQRRRSKAKKSDGKRSRKAKKSGKHSNAMLYDGKSKRRYRRSKRSNAMLDGKSKSKRRRRSKRVHFDGTNSALKKWLESLKRK
jgi:hypothetical protein